VKKFKPLKWIISNQDMIARTLVFNYEILFPSNNQHYYLVDCYYYVDSGKIIHEEDFRCQTLEEAKKWAETHWQKTANKKFKTLLFKLLFDERTNEGRMKHV
jgi:hypothetical protein